LGTNYASLLLWRALGVEVSQIISIGQVANRAVRFSKFRNFAKFLDHDNLRYLPLEWKKALSEIFITKLSDEFYSYFWQHLQDSIGYEIVIQLNSLNSDFLLRLALLLQ